MEICHKICNKLNSWATHPDDPPLTITRNLICLRMYLLLGGFDILALVYLLTVSETFEDNLSLHVFVFEICMSVAGVAYVVYTKRVSETVAVATVTLYAIGGMLWDIRSMSHGSARVWPCLILGIDIFLVFRTKRCFIFCYIFMILVYLFITAAESAFRFGLFDLPGMATEEMRDKRVSCSNPPCKEDIGTICYTWASFCFIVLVDYYFTRTFADRMVAEKERVEASVSTANNIASALATFDLSSAAASLEDTTLPLPEELKTAFQTLLTNLQGYKPYLPDALFEVHKMERMANSVYSESSMSSREPPGLASQSSTIVFTDIQGSTALWEASPSGMKKGLEVHNKVLRKGIKRFGGYEVKTIGDSFMVAFETVQSAVMFSLGMQEDLYTSEEWPSELTSLPECGNGMLVRIGINYGEVDLQINPVTGRYDYFGSTVNKAARVEGACCGGGVAVPDELLDTHDDESPLSLAEVLSIRLDDEQPPPFIMSMGTIELRGIGEVAISVLVPGTMPERQKHVDERLVQMHRFSVSINAKSLTLAAISKSTSVTVTPPTLEERLTNRSSVTIGTVGIDLCTVDVPMLTVNHVNDVLSKVIHCLERSEGTVVSLVSSSLTTAWNVARRCESHLENAVRYVDLLRTADVPFDVYTGIACGDVLFGAVGGSSQRFVTVLGSCVSLAASLCGGAKALGTFCLHAAVPGHVCSAVMHPSLRLRVRPVDTWDVQDEASVVYEVCCKRVAERELWEWSEEYHNAFHGRATDVIAEHVEADGVLQKAVLLLSKGTHVGLPVSRF